MSARQSNTTHTIKAPSAARRFHALDSFRGICAVFVVLFHTRILHSFSEYSFFRNGHRFVEFFFILSGFVMCYTYGEAKFNREKMKDFMIGRTFRLYPMHILMLLFFLGLELFKLYGSSKGMVFDKEPFTDQQAPGQILPNLLLIHAWIPGISSNSFNYVSWSISIEFYLYVIFGLVLMFIPARQKLAFAVISLTALTALFLHINIPTYEALRGLFCFFAGCFLFFIYKKTEAAVLNKMLFTLLECLAITSVVLITLANIENKNIYISLIFAFTILVFAFEKGSLSDLLKARPFLFLGQLSYSIYIIHAGILAALMPVITMAGKVLHKNLITITDNGSEKIRFVTSHNVYIDNIFTLVILGLTITISYFTYTYVEVRFIALGKKYRAKVRSSGKVNRTSLV
ncbi:acyltransferase [Chitinophaga sp. S165]|uniref:acyltransferase family protein n=1 Tax=Chitinophaga sp. S165 TaxID=2135462 RepID=UPI000D70EA9E|nr:acyltransferase [Chitinophaga sp. S165]PWV51957.1 peptidoglycan/LPS O-acetylase OafA/YrhL [Chitinophaga sp. S165]